MLRVDMSDQLFSTNDVCRAAGISRGTFDAWVLRGYFGLGPGPGTGRQREFTLLQTIRLAAAAELVRVGVGVSIAASASSRVQERMYLGDQQFALILASPRAAPVDSRSTERGPAVACVNYASWDELREFLAQRMGQPSPAAVAMVEIGVLAARVSEALQIASQVPEPLTMKSAGDAHRPRTASTRRRK